MATLDTPGQRRLAIRRFIANVDFFVKGYLVEATARLKMVNTQDKQTGAIILKWYSNRNILLGILRICQVGRRAPDLAALPDLRTIGHRIRVLRGEIRQEDLASELGISQGQLSKIERGGIAPTLDVLVRVAAKFDKSMDWLVFGNKR